MYLISLSFLCAAHNLHCVTGYFLFPSPLATIFFKFLYSENPRESAWRVLFRPPWCFLHLAIEGHQNLTHVNSRLLISRTFPPHTGSSCTSFLFVISVLYTKNVLKRAQFRRYSTTFFNHFTVFLRNE